jgi:hypothetical protein
VKVLDLDPGAGSVVRHDGTPHRCAVASQATIGEVRDTPEGQETSVRR